jgi:hypothetical protein
MHKNRFTEEQIIGIVPASAAGAKTPPGAPTLEEGTRCEGREAT